MYNLRVLVEGLDMSVSAERVLAAGFFDTELVRVQSVITVTLLESAETVKEEIRDLCDALPVVASPYGPDTSAFGSSDQA